MLVLYGSADLDGQHLGLVGKLEPENAVEHRISRAVRREVAHKVLVDCDGLLVILFDTFRPFLELCAIHFHLGALK